MTHRSSISSDNSKTFLLKNRSSSLSEFSTSNKMTTPPNVSTAQFSFGVSFGDEPTCSVYLSNLKVHRSSETGEVTETKSHCLQLVDAQVLTKGPPDYVRVAILMCVCFPLSGLPFLWLSYKSRHANQTGNFNVAWKYSDRALYVFTSGMLCLVFILLIVITLIWVSRHGMPEETVVTSWKVNVASVPDIEDSLHLDSFKSSLYSQGDFGIETIQELIEFWERQ